MKLTPEEFLELIEPEKKTSEIIFGKVDPSYVSGRPKVIIDGSSAVSTKLYPYLSSYTPAANDRIMIIKGVVIGKIV